MHILTLRMRPYTFIVLAYMTVFLGAALLMGNKEFLFYGVTMAVIISVIVYMDKRVTFSALVLSGLALWGFMHMAGGIVPVPDTLVRIDQLEPVLYNARLAPYLPKYDQVVHAIGFGVSLIAAYEALQAHLKRALALTAPMIAALFFIAMGLGALNELIEFTAVLLIPDTNVGGYENTGWDLVSNACGAILALVVLKFRSKAA